MPLKPDPTFYPSPRSAIEAPREELAYIVTLNEAGTGATAPDATGEAKPDALVVVDLSTGEKVGRLDMPNVGDELHHFGWNAWSSALSPWAPRPHVERRYPLVPGLKSSRRHIVDVKDDLRSPKLDET